jgi:hypothetical protein
VSAQLLRFEVEYDLSFWGGEYNDVGNFVTIEAATEGDLADAFHKQTTYSPLHIIHYVQLSDGDLVDERCPACDDPSNVFAYERDQHSGRCYLNGVQIYTCQHCGFDLTPHLGE